MFGIICVKCHGVVFVVSNFFEHQMLRTENNRKWMINLLCPHFTMLNTAGICPIYTCILGSTYVTAI